MYGSYCNGKTYETMEWIGQWFKNLVFCISCEITDFFRVILMNI